MTTLREVLDLQAQLQRDHSQLRQDHNVLTAQVQTLQRGLSENTTLTKETKDNTQEIIAFFREWSTVFRFGRKLGALIKWGAGVAAGIGVMYATWRGLK